MSPGEQGGAVQEKTIQSGNGSSQNASRPCWSCHGPVRNLAPFCHVCGVIQKPAAVNHFERLNLPMQFDLAKDDLERQYFGFQRTFHPDRFVAKSARERAIAMEYATSLNEAYQTLKTTLGRAEHLLEIRGHDIAGKDGKTIDDPVLLMEVMEMRESVTSAKGEAEMNNLAGNIAVQVSRAESALQDAFTGDLMDIALQQALRLRYLSKLAQEVKQRSLALSQGPKE